MHQKDDIKMRTEAPGLWAKDLVPNFAIIVNCRLGNGQGYHSLRVLGGGEIHTEVHQLPQDCWLSNPQSNDSTPFDAGKANDHL